MIARVANWQREKDRAWREFNALRDGNENSSLREQAAPRFRAA